MRNYATCQLNEKVYQLLFIATWVFFHFRNLWWMAYPTFIEMLQPTLRFFFISNSKYCIHCEFRALKAHANVFYDGCEEFPSTTRVNRIVNKSSSARNLSSVSYYLLNKTSTNERFKQTFRKHFSALSSHLKSFFKQYCTTSNLMQQKLDKQDEICRLIRYK